jgi:hypothetical protein
MRLLFTCLVGLAFWAMPLRSIAADNNGKCAVTKAPSPPFVPQTPYSRYAGENSFLYGTDSLWTIVQHPGAWKLGRDGMKLAYLRRGYDYMKERAPQLTVLGRRLDIAAPLVRSDGATGGMANGTDPGGMFMLTRIDIPAAGCWEISAHYADQTLTYTVWVER